MISLLFNQFKLLKHNPTIFLNWAEECKEQLIKYFLISQLYQKYNCFSNSSCFSSKIGVTASILCRYLKIIHCTAIQKLYSLNMKASYEVLTSPLQNLMSNFASPYFPSFLRKGWCPIFRKKKKRSVANILKIYYLKIKQSKVWNTINGRGSLLLET